MPHVVRAQALELLAWIAADAAKGGYYARNEDVAHLRVLVAVGLVELRAGEGWHVTVAGKDYLALYRQVPKKQRLTSWARILGDDV